MEIALTLLEYGASPNCKTRMDVTPLHLASQEGHTDMCSVLVAKDANVNAHAKVFIFTTGFCFWMFVKRNFLVELSVELISVFYCKVRSANRNLR